MDRTLRTWAEEVLEVIEDRRSVVLSTAVALVVLGVVLTFALPDLLPPRPSVGAAVGFAAVVLGVAAALARDAVDDTVRGARHVRAAGGEPLAVLPGAPDPATLSELAERLVDAAAHGSFRLALSPVSKQISTVPRWGRALAVELSRRELRVVSVDLGSGPDRDGGPGVLEVVRDGVRLGDAVTFDQELLLAELGPGADDEEAVAAWPRLANQLPSDIDVVVLSLPPVTRPGVLQALGTAHQAWLFAASDRTARVDLIAGLDAADRTDTPTGVVLLAPDQAQPAPAPAGPVGPEDPAPEASAPASGPAPGPSTAEGPASAEPTAASPFSPPDAADLPPGYRDEVVAHGEDEVGVDAEVAPHEHRADPFDVDPDARVPEDAPRIAQDTLPPEPRELMIEPGEADTAGLSVAQSDRLDERGIPPSPGGPADDDGSERDDRDDRDQRDDTVDLGDLGIPSDRSTPAAPRLEPGEEARPPDPEAAPPTAGRDDEAAPPASEAGEAAPPPEDTREPYIPRHNTAAQRPAAPDVAQPTTPGASPDAQRPTQPVAPPARDEQDDDRPTFLVEPAHPDDPEDPVRVAASLHAFADDLFDRG